jgi:osmoprotectant transport system permease protein
MIGYLTANWDLVAAALRQHLVLALVPVVLGTLLALPLGTWAARSRWLYPVLMAASGILYSIPSLALFVVLPGILRTKILDPANVVVALTFYTAALLVRTIADALRAVDPAVVQAAEAMGYRPARRLLAVELPVALPVLLAGLRSATVANISMVSVGALIGVGGLGTLFTRGLQVQYLDPILLGITLSVLLAVTADALLVLLQRSLTPWTRAQGRA